MRVLVESERAFAISAIESVLPSLGFEVRRSDGLPVEVLCEGHHFGSIEIDAFFTTVDLFGSRGTFTNKSAAAQLRKRSASLQLAKRFVLALAEEGFSAASRNGVPTLRLGSLVVRLNEQGAAYRDTSDAFGSEFFPLSVRGLAEALVSIKAHASVQAS